MKKKIISLILIASMLFAQSVSAATMYALDGRTLEVDDSEIEAYRQVNWYYGKPVTMYALDGRTLTVGENDVEMYRQVGWFYGKPVTMHALDGRTLTVGENDVEMYKAVGWYMYPMIKLYSWDGKTAMFPENEVAAQLKVGWYREPVQVLYTLDGRSAVFPKSEVAAQLTVGWYTTKEKWKVAYTDILREEIISLGEYHMLNGASFSLIYVDNNNIPELVIFSDVTFKIYTFKDNKAVYCGSFGRAAGANHLRFQTLYYREKCNQIMLYCNCDIDDYYEKILREACHIYEISNGKTSHLISFECNHTIQNTRYRYKINSNSVSEDAYYNNANNYHLTRSSDGLWLSTGQYTDARKVGGYTLDESNIISVFE